ncbi:MAG: hypothetical protein ACM4D3_16875 [Candidatus Sericytochromatia bacterium]
MDEFTWGTQAFMKGFANRYEHIEVRVDKTRPPSQRYGCRIIRSRETVAVQRFESPGVPVSVEGFNDRGDPVDYFRRYRSLTADELTQLAELGLEHDDDDPAFAESLVDFLLIKGDFGEAIKACQRRRAKGQRCLRAYVVQFVRAYRRHHGIERRAEFDAWCRLTSGEHSEPGS